METENKRALTRSTSCDCEGLRCGVTFAKQRSLSFTLPTTEARSRVARPRCPTGREGREDDSEWGKLSEELIAAFARCSDISADHPAARCIASCNPLRLHGEIVKRGTWKAGEYTRTTLLSADGFLVMLLCWAPGCASPVHAHSDVETAQRSNCFMLILEGALEETVYLPEALSSDGKTVDPLGSQSRILDAGDAAYINDSMGVHRVANPHAERAISLHVYAPGWKSAPLYEVDAGGAPIDVDAWGDF